MFYETQSILKFYFNIKLMNVINNKSYVLNFVNKKIFFCDFIRILNSKYHLILMKNFINNNSKRNFI